MTKTVTKNKTKENEKILNSQGNDKESLKLKAGISSLGVGKQKSKSTKLNISSENVRCAACSCSSDVEADLLQCSICSLHYHGRCLDFDDETVDLLQLVIINASWVCQVCIDGAKNLARFDSKTIEANKVENEARISLEKKVDELLLRIIELERKLSNGTLAKNTKSYAGAVSSGCVVAEQNNSVAGTSATNKLNSKTIVDLVQKGLKEKELKAHNIVVSGIVPSSEAGDADLIKDLCFSCLDLDIGSDIKSCKRLGKREPPLLLVSFNSVKTADLVLDNAKVLRRNPDPIIKNSVYINRDLTKTESKEAYDRRVQKRTEKQKTTLSPEAGIFAPESQKNSSVSSDNTTNANEMSVSQPDNVDLVDHN